MGEKNTLQGFMGKAEEKKPLGIPMRRNEDNIKMGVKEIGLEVMDRIHLTRERGKKSEI
jgi:hypothetical protein